MNVCAVLLPAALTASLAIPQVSRLSSSEIDAAIDQAKTPRFLSFFVEATGRLGAEFSVVAQGPIGRTRDAARDAFESYKPLKAEDISKNTGARELTLIVVRHDDTHGSIKNVVIMPTGAVSRDAAVQPIIHRSAAGAPAIVRDQLPRTWKPSWSTTAVGIPQSFRFPEEALPWGDLTIVVATDQGEERYTIKQKDRDRIR